MSEVAVTLISGPYHERAVAENMALTMNRMIGKVDSCPFVAQEYGPDAADRKRWVVIIRPLYVKHNTFVVTFE